MTAKGRLVRRLEDGRGVPQLLILRSTPPHQEPLEDNTRARQPRAHRNRLAPPERKEKKELKEVGGGDKEIQL